MNCILGSPLYFEFRSIILRVPFHSTSSHFETCQTSRLPIEKSHVRNWKRHVRSWKSHIRSWKWHVSSKTLPVSTKWLPMSSWRHRMKIVRWVDEFWHFSAYGDAFKKKLQITIKRLNLTVQQNVIDCTCIYVPMKSNENCLRSYTSKYHKVINILADRTRNLTNSILHEYCITLQ